MQEIENSQYIKALKRLNSKECATCMGLGFLDNEDQHDIPFTRQECPECLGTGYGMILPRPDADNALKRIIKILTPRFVNISPLDAVNTYVVDILPTSEIIFEDYDEGILILKLFRDIIICVTKEGFAWIEYENR